MSGLPDSVEYIEPLVDKHEGISEGYVKVKNRITLAQTFFNGFFGVLVWFSSWVFCNLTFL